MRCTERVKRKEMTSDTLTAPTYVHLLAGGTGATVGAVVTCPLEVVKTRFQSSVPTFRTGLHPSPGVVGIGTHSIEGAFVRPSGIMSCLKHMVKTEGVSSLFRGLGASVAGFAPSRAIFFAVYSKAKTIFNQSGFVHPDGKLVHMLSSCSAGALTSTVTSPIWVSKTRLQLNNRPLRGNLKTVVKEIYQFDGVKGFYRGLTASYIGLSETVIYFIIYEHIKAKCQEMNKHRRGTNKRTMLDFVEYMLAAATSKCTASVIAYPHEVIRTRLRQQEVDGRRKYHSFTQAFVKIMREEGRRGLYGGLCTHLIRVVPNTATIFLTYEAVVYLLSKESVVSKQSVV